MKFPIRTGCWLPLLLSVAVAGCAPGVQRKPTTVKQASDVKITVGPQPKAKPAAADEH